MPPAPPGPLPGAVVPGVALQDVEDISDAVLLQAQWSGAMPYHRSAEVPGTVERLADLLPPGARLRLDQRADHWRAVLADVDGAIVHVRVRWGITNIAVVGAALAPVQALVTQLVAAARAEVALPDGTVRMRFWSSGAKSPTSAARKVTSPSWDEVAANYPAATAAALAPLVSATSLDGRSGRLVLWHGAPGTGKTSAVRALMHAWQGWARPVVVTDPERMLTDGRYLRRLLLDVHDEVDDDGDELWQLLVLEDAEALLRKDTGGPAMSRLLNLTDGLLGQGLRCLFLITTNEPLAAVHPAVVRPGRCLAQVEFGPLPAAQAAALLVGWSGVALAAGGWRLLRRDAG